MGRRPDRATLLGLSLYSAAGASCSPDCGGLWKAGLVGAGIGAAIGAGIDALHKGRKHVYGTRPGSAPVSQAPLDSLGTLWSRVRPGDSIYVRETSGEDFVGTFSRASESSLTMAVNGQSREIPAVSVQHVVRRRGGNHVRRGLLIGASIGALLGTRGCYRVDNVYNPAGSGPSCGASVLADRRLAAEWSGHRLDRLGPEGGI